MKRLLLFPLISIVFFLSTFSNAQLWSGIIDPSRAVDWSQAGVPGGIPSRTTQCGSTIAAYSGTASTINNAIAACPAGQFVSLGAGTFTLSSGISFGGNNNVTLRGQGANQTFIVTNKSGWSGAGFYNAAVSMESTQLNENDSEGNVCNFTSGYSQGSTTITLANCGSTTPARGGISNLRVGGILLLDQLDEVNDTGTIWNCATQGICANTVQGGASRQDGTCNGSMCLRSQQQGVIVSSCDGNSTPGHACSSGTNIGISPGLYMPNWRSAQKPQAWYVNSSQMGVGMGLENLTINDTANATQQTIMNGNCDGCYVKGVRSIDANRSHVRMLFATRFSVQDSYFFKNQGSGSVSYGVEIMGGWNGLIQNNIFQQDTDSEPSCSGPCAGNVVAYNFDIDNVWWSGGWMQAGFYQHSSGDVFNLWEGNIGPGYTSDDVHGTHHFETVFRNRLIGWQKSGCGGSPCVQQTIPVNAMVGSRYFNIIGNVLGETNYHTNYKCKGVNGTPDNTNGDVSIYALGAAGNECRYTDGSLTNFCQDPSCTSHNHSDPQVWNYAMIWGNYDVVNASNQFNSNEVPSSINPYGNGVPGNESLPSSFYLSAKPSWWQTGPWPPIGPDVTSGNLGRCSGGTYDGTLGTSSSQCTGGTLVADVAGEANSNPAMDCYLSLGGPPDGSGSVLSFNADQCYGTSDPPPPPPTNLTSNVQ